MTLPLFINEQSVLQQIYTIRKTKVMLASDLAMLYGVQTKVLNQAVKRQLKRFPRDFMFQLSDEEFNCLRSQIVTIETKPSRGQHTKYLPYVFTEQGVAMLSSVLNSDIAIEVNIQIMRIFTKIREVSSSSHEILSKVEALEKAFLNQDEKLQQHDEEIAVIFKYMKTMLQENETNRSEIGYKTKSK